MNRYINLLCLIPIAIAAFCPAVQSQGLVDSRPASASSQQTQLSSASLMIRGDTADYALGSGDQIALTVAGLEEEFNSKVFRIDTTGDVTLPMVGRVHAAGLSTAALEGQLGGHRRSRGQHASRSSPTITSHGLAWLY